MRFVLFHPSNFVMKKLCRSLMKIPYPIDSALTQILYSMHKFLTRVLNITNNAVTQNLYSTHKF